MCYHYSEYEELDDMVIKRSYVRYGDKEYLKDVEFYYTNGFDHRALPIITQQRPEEIQLYNWGLIHSYSKSMKEALENRTRQLNTRDDKLWSGANLSLIRKQRCLILANGFYEWHTEGKMKYPYYLMIKDDDFPDVPRNFCFGGLNNTWIDKDSGEVMNTFSMITTEANEVLKWVHNSTKRMPLILRLEDEKHWLNPNLSDDGIKALIKPYDDTKTFGHSISKYITAKFNGMTSSDALKREPKVIEPYNYDSPTIPEWIDLGTVIAMQENDGEKVDDLQLF